LKLGELWAIPSCCGLLIENLRRLAALITKNRINKILQITGQTNDGDQKKIRKSYTGNREIWPGTAHPWKVLLLLNLHADWSERGSFFTISWIEQRLSEQGMTSDELVHIENQNRRQIRHLSVIVLAPAIFGGNNWRDFVEDISVVEKFTSEHAAFIL
jgi:hypothetical protein